MNRNSATYYYFFDGLGSVTDITDAAGNVVESYNYDAYGQPTTLSTIGNRFYFTGRELDTETGLYHYRARSYFPGIGRFAQRDPLGYVDSMNLYAYVANNPTNYVDPYGLWGVQFGDVNIGIGPSTFLFKRGSGSYFRQTLAATADGFIPFFDPFGLNYNQCDKNLKISRQLGALSRNLFLVASALKFYEVATGIRIEVHGTHGGRALPHLQGIKGPGWGRTLWRFPRH